jgi:choline-sulfatase
VSPAPIEPPPRLIFTATAACTFAALLDLAHLAWRSLVVHLDLAAMTAVVLVTAACTSALGIGSIQHLARGALFRIVRSSLDPQRSVVRATSALLWILAATLWFASAAERWGAWSTGVRAGVVAIALLLLPLVHGMTSIAVHFLDRARRGSRVHRTVLVGLALGVGLVAAAADRHVLPRLYPRLHDGLLILELLAFQTAALALLSGRPSPSVGRITRVSLGVVLLLGLTLSTIWLDRNPRLTFVVLDQAPLASRLLVGARRVLDRDGDGYSFALGGGDCDDTDPTINPGSFDFPEDGVDQDCSGADATFATLRAPAPPAPPRAARFDVLLITVDALRPDHLGVYGYPRATSPNIDAFATGALRLRRAYAQANATGASLPSLHTGRYPSTSPWRYGDPRGFPGWPLLTDAENHTLAEILRDAGYRTGAVSHGEYTERIGLFQGFESFAEGYLPLVWKFERFLDQDDGRPWLFWMHFAQPHYPYTQHASFDFGSETIDRYDSEIALADDEVGHVLRALERMGRPSETIVILTSDHGEAFGEHQSEQHGTTLYEEQIRVPLLMRAPGLTPGWVDHPAELVDVLPTILSIVGVNPPLVDGHSLFGLLTDPPVSPTTAYSERYFGGLDQRALVAWPHKLIEHLGSNARVELYDLERDPGELSDLAGARPELLRGLREELGRVTARSELLLLVSARKAEDGADLRLARNLVRLSRPSARIEAARVLEHARYPEVPGLIADAIEQGGLSATTAVDFVHTLERMTLPEAEGALLRLTKVPDPEVNDAAREALRRRTAPPTAR